MKIKSSDIALASQHSLVNKDIHQESMQLWVGNRAGQNSLRPNNGLVASLAQKLNDDMVEISAKAKALFQEKLRQTNKADSQSDLSNKDPKIALIETLLSALTGKKIEIKTVDLDGIYSPAAVNGEIMDKAAANQASQQSFGWGFRFDSYDAHIEQEATNFTAGGSVTTADGKQINFAMDLTMTRQYIEENRISIRAGDALKDPLVINFSAPAAKLTELKYDFDIDSDGEKDKISFVAPGSGFLALDNNNDGKINDGSELFGTESGNGFADLARFDDDGNNWIDENDSVYGKLRLWTKDENGADQLMSLKDADVGAIYLSNVASAFSLKDSDNSLLGQIKATGLFLRDNGPAGTVQQVDIAV